MVMKSNRGRWAGHAKRIREMMNAAVILQENLKERYHF
jgi:hypothetical protein